jgi:hypothetical protein
MTAETPTELPPEQIPQNAAKERIKGVLLATAAVGICITVGINAAMSVYIVKYLTEKSMQSLRRGFGNKSGNPQA